VLPEKQPVKREVNTINAKIERIPKFEGHLD
jgi:hypothetical protein